MAFRFFALSLAMSLAFVVVIAANDVARSMAGEFMSDETVLVDEGTVIEGDLYVSGKDVTIRGQVKGDLIGFCQNATISGSVGGSVNLAAQSILVEGHIARTARLAGQVILITDTGVIAGDLLAACFSLEIELDGEVHRNALIYSYQSLINGNIDHNLHGGMANCEFNGYVGGNIDIDVSAGEGNIDDPNAYSESPDLEIPEVKPGFNVGSTAVVEGSVIYYSTEEGTFADSAQILGEKKFHLVESEPNLEEKKPFDPKSLTIDKAKQFGLIIVAGLIFFLLAPSTSRGVADNIRLKPLLSSLLGVVAILLAAFVIGAIIAITIALSVVCGMVTLYELIPFIILGGLFILSWVSLGSMLYIGYFSVSTFCTFVGQALLGILLRSQRTARFFPLIVGGVVFVALSAIPYAQLALYPIAICVGSGALFIRLVSRKEPRRNRATRNPAAGKMKR